MPELLRVEGGLLLAEPQSNSDDAEKFLTQSLELSRHQGARMGVAYRDRSRDANGSAGTIR